MQIRISGYYTEVNYHFDLSNRFMALLRQSIQSIILEKKPLSVKAKELEIYICTNAQNQDHTVEKISKTDKGKYLTFHFWIPYGKVVKGISEKFAVEMDLDAFVNEFFECLKMALLPYGISEKPFEECKNTVLTEIKDKKEYHFEITAQESDWRLSAQKIIAEFEQKRTTKLTLK
jgi:hypothetical protein